MKPVIVISAINFINGGPLSILQDCLSYLNNSEVEHYRIVALVNDKSLLKDVDNIQFIEFPKSVNSYLYRLYYEYIYFKGISKRLNPHLWLSLHDVSPNVKATIRAVYCHNPSPFYKLNFKEFLTEPKFVIFNFLYKFVYKINIKKNDYVIVQQDWLRKEFERLFGLKSTIVAYPSISSNASEIVEKKNSQNPCFTFFFPTMPRFFKNIEVIIDATTLALKKGYSFKVIITVDGTENRYAKKMVKSADGIDNLEFIGRVSRERVFELYKQADCLIFPSKLETWGLPITEFKLFQKPIIVSALPYAYETVAGYEKAMFFNPYSPTELAEYMIKAMSGKNLYSKRTKIKVVPPFSQSWTQLFDIILDSNSKSG